MSRPSSSRWAWRPVTTSSRSAVNSAPPPPCTVNAGAVVARPVRRVTPVWILTPSARSAAAATSDASGSSMASTRSERLDHGHPDAEPGEDLGQLQPDRAAAEHEQRLRQLLDLDRLVVGPVRRVGQPVDRRDRRAGAGAEHDPVPGLEHLVADADPAGPVEPAAAPHEPAALAGEPVHRHRVVPGVGGLLADPLRHRRPVRAGPAPSPASSSTRRASASAFAARIIILLGTQPQYGHSPPTRSRSIADHAQAGLGEPPGHLLAADAEPDHDHVHQLRLRHPASIPHSAAPPTTGRGRNVPAAQWPRRLPWPDARTLRPGPGLLPRPVRRRPGDRGRPDHLVRRRSRWSTWSAAPARPSRPAPCPATGPATRGGRTRW